METQATEARIKSYIERIERLDSMKQEVVDDISEVYKEAKSEGFDVKVMKKIVSLRKMDTEDRVMQEELLDVYKRALGMIIGE